MKFHTAVVALLAVTTSSLTTTNAFLQQSSPRRTMAPRSMAVDSDVDLKIPYDAAARLAYDEWRAKYNKGAFDDERYQVFKDNYEAITVANVVAKKQARDEEGEPPALMTLNEYGDCTEEEYIAAMNTANAPQPTTTGDVLGKAMESAQSQSEASNALKDAADALAEDEEVRNKKKDKSSALLRRQKTALEILCLSCAS